MLVKISKKGFQKMENLQLNRIEENLQILTTLLQKQTTHWSDLNWCSTCRIWI